MCLVKIMVDIYVQQKTCIKYLVVVAFQKCFLRENASKYFFIFKKLFFILTYQNDLNNTKNINLK